MSESSPKDNLPPHPPAETPPAETVSDSPSSESTASQTSSDASTETAAPAVEPFEIFLPDEPGSSGDWYLWASLLGLLSLVSFWPATNGSFIWDDDRYVTANPALASLHNLLHAWIPPICTVQFYPLTHTILFLENLLFQGQSKEAPLGFHVVNLALHALSAMVLWRVLRRLRVPAAWIAAGVWAVHPLQAESVAWISEIKNILSGLFAFSSLLFYLDYAGLRDVGTEDRLWKLNCDWPLLAMSLLLYVLAILSKSVVCTLPVALAAILWWKRVLNRRTLLGLLPMVVLGLMMAAVTIHFETSPQGFVAAHGEEWHVPLIQRFWIAGRGLWFYLAKILLPMHLSFNYARIIPGTPAGLLYLGGFAIGVFILSLLSPSIGRGPITAVICYVALIFPALGFFTSYPFLYSFVWDHFQYLAAAPVIVLVISILATLLGSPGIGVSERNSTVGFRSLLGAILLGVLAAASWSRAGVFNDSTSLWTDTLVKNPDSWFAAYNLAVDHDRVAEGLMILADKQRAGGNADLAQQFQKSAAQSLNDSEALLKTVQTLPNVPTRFQYLALTQIAAINSRRATFPNANVPQLLNLAKEQLLQAIAIERVGQDWLPYYNLGVVLNQQAAALRARTIPMSHLGAASSATAPTTRPATPDEQAVIDLLTQAMVYFNQSLRSAQAAADLPATAAAARQRIAETQVQLGQITWQLSALAALRHDTPAADQLAQETFDHDDAALQINPVDIRTQYNAGLALERLGRDEDALVYLKHAILSDAPNDYRFAPGFDEVGFLEMRLSRHERLLKDAVIDTEIAIEMFKAALQVDPNFPGAADNLRYAEQVESKLSERLRKASTAASTQSSTQPVTAP